MSNAANAPEDQTGLPANPRNVGGSNPAHGEFPEQAHAGPGLAAVPPEYLTDQSARQGIAPAEVAAWHVQQQQAAQAMAEMNARPLSTHDAAIDYDGPETTATAPGDLSAEYGGRG